MPGLHILDGEMLNSLRRRWNEQACELRGRIIAIYIVLAFANVTTWAWALFVFRWHPVLLGTAMLAYGFGLRHAVDADHIAAIDNVTRKLMQEDKRPATIGFWFALGHSTALLQRSILTKDRFQEVLGKSRFQTGPKWRILVFATEPHSSRRRCRLFKNHIRRSLRHYQSETERDLPTGRRDRQAQVVKAKKTLQTPSATEMKEQC